MISDKGILPTDLSQFQVTINGKDVSQAISGVIIYQDVLSPIWTCELQVADTNNLIMNVPIAPGSTIEIEIESNQGFSLNGSKSYEFVVFGINDKKFINSKFQTYMVSGVSPEIIKNQSIRVKKSYQAQSPTDIATNIIKNSLGASLEVDSSENTITTIVSNLSPFTAVNKMCKVALCNGAADMILFQIDTGKFAMKSIEKMYSDTDSGVTFILKPAGIKDNSGNSTTDLTLSIVDYNMEHFNAMSSLGSGMFGNKTVSFDFMSKAFTSKTFKYGDDNKQDNSKKSWDSETFESPNSNITFVPKHTNLHTDDTAFTSMDKWVGSRKSSIMKLEQDRLILQVPGAVKAWELIGKSFNVDMPSQQSMSDGEDLDLYYKGAYLCIAIAHFYGKHGAWVNIAGVKKRLEKSMNSSFSIS